MGCANVPLVPPTLDVASNSSLEPETNEAERRATVEETTHHSVAAEYSHSDFLG